MFVSFRFGEAHAEAKAIKAALEQQGVSVFVCDVAEGESIADEVIRALRGCTLAVVLGTRTYGAKTGSTFSSYYELRYIVERRKPFFLLKMCDTFETDYAHFHLCDDIAYYQWAGLATAASALPNITVNILKKLDALNKEDESATTSGSKKKHRVV